MTAVQPLSELTTIRVGGTPAEIYEAKTRDDLIEHTLGVWRSGEDWLVLGGGSNLVVADDVPNLHVIKVANLGIEPVRNRDESRVVVRVQAGESWDAFVAHTIEVGLAGIEAMSGIPGTVGAAPVQNIGAYGQELSDSMVRLEFVDYETHEVAILEAKDLQFGYRDSAIKRGRPGVITWVEFELQKLDGLSRPLYSTQIAADLGTSMGWALRTWDDYITSGTVSFMPSRYDGGGMRYLRCRRWLEQLGEQAGPIEAVYFEEVRRHASTDSSHVHGGFLSILETWCEENQIPYQGVPVGTIRIAMALEEARASN